jgi:hypothetical protein
MSDGRQWPGHLQLVRRQQLGCHPSRGERQIRQRGSTTSNAHEGCATCYQRRHCYRDAAVTWLAYVRCSQAGLLTLKSWTGYPDITKQSRERLASLQRSLGSHVSPGGAWSKGATRMHDGHAGLGSRLPIADTGMVTGQSAVTTEGGLAPATPVAPQDAPCQ